MATYIENPTKTMQYHKLLSGLVQTCWSETDESNVLEPYTYLKSKSGKEVRAQLIAAFNLWLEVPHEKLVIIERIVSMLHNASLLVDDVEDNSTLRRGHPVAHKIYGVPQTINTANYVYFQAMEELSALQDLADSPNDKLYKIIVDELMNLHRGQGLDLYWRDNLLCPTEEAYIAMVNNKTGGLFRLAIRLMMATATKNIGVDFIPLVNLIGVFFQIRDDYCNLQSGDYTSNKGYAEDLTEGKFSFPIVHGINANPSDRQLLNILQKRPSTPTLKDHAISILERSTGSFDYTLAVLDQLERQTKDELARLGGNMLLEAIVDALSNKM
jgi:geranylgeranyl diphosphate synthase type 3